MATNNGDTVTVPAVEYESYRKAYEKQHAKYGGMTDDEIDNLIDIRVETERQAWLRDIALNRMDMEVERVRELQVKHQLDLDASMKRTVKLREAVLTEMVRMPVDEGGTNEQA